MLVVVVVVGLQLNNAEPTFNKAISGRILYYIILLHTWHTQLDKLGIDEIFFSKGFLSNVDMTEFT